MTCGCIDATEGGRQRAVGRRQTAPAGEVRVFRLHLGGSGLQEVIFQMVKSMVQL